MIQWQVGGFHEWLQKARPSELRIVLLRDESNRERELGLSLQRRTDGGIDLFFMNILDHVVVGRPKGPLLSGHYLCTLTAEYFRTISQLTVFITISFKWDHEKEAIRRFVERDTHHALYQFITLPDNAIVSVNRELLKKKWDWFREYVGDDKSREVYYEMRLVVSRETVQAVVDFLLLETFAVDGDKTDYFKLIDFCYKYAVDDMIPELISYMKASIGLSNVFSVYMFAQGYKDGPWRNAFRGLERKALEEMHVMVNGGYDLQTIPDYLRMTYDHRWIVVNWLIRASYEHLLYEQQQCLIQQRREIQQHMRLHQQQLNFEMEVDEEYTFRGRICGRRYRSSSMNGMVLKISSTFPSYCFIFSSSSFSSRYFFLALASC